MAITRGLLFVVITALSALHSFSAIRPSTNDFWDVASSSTVSGTSGVRFGFDVNAIFGANTSIERGSTVFDDGRPNGYTHYVEWQTPAPFRLNRFHLFAAGDGPIYNNEREFAQFVLKAKRNASDPYTTVYSFTPTHPYTFADPTNSALIAVDVPAIDAQYFRAEFVQMNAGRGYDGPRVVELDGFGTEIPAIIPQSDDDLWDVSNGISITGSSGFWPGFHATDMFGTMLSTERGQSVFADGRTNGSTHFIEWNTANPVLLTGFNLFAAGDGAIYNHEREFGQFVLKAKRNISDPFTTIYTFNPSHPYEVLDPISHAILSETFAQPIEAQFFRAEFVQWDAGRGYDGPRVIELDGFGSEIAATIPQSREDLWDVSNGVSVTSSSGFRGGFYSTDIFGSTLSIERGQSVFDDGRPNGYTHFIEWNTPTLVSLSGFNLFAGGDGAIYNHEREFGQFILKAKRNSSDPFTTLYTFNPTHPYQVLDPISQAILSETFAQPVEAQFFRAEFVQWNAGRGFDGPRVVELDGFGTAIRPPHGPAADWTFEEGTPGQRATNVLDHSGNGHHGQVQGSAFYRASQGSGNGSVSLEISSGAHFAPAASSAFNFRNDDFTLEAIINPGPGNIEANRGIIVAQNPENGALSYVLDYRSESRTANFFLAAANGEQNFVTAVIPNDGISHHLAGVRRGSVLSIYLDKQLVESRTISINPNLPAAGPVALRVGASSAGYWFEGILDRVRISRGALEPSAFIPYQSPALSILQQPQSQTAIAGTNVSLFVTVSSNAAPTYQWFFNGAALTGKTDRVLLLMNVQPANQGSYTVRVSAGGESILSEPAELTIVPGTPSQVGGPVKDDLFDISEGNQVTRHSGTFPSIRITGMFGDEGPSMETGSTIFADGRTNGFTHFVEWKTPTPVNLRGFKLFAGGDGAIYLHEREFQTFTLKAKSSVSATTFDRVIYHYNATHPYSFQNPTNALLIDATIDPVVAQEFRAEFVQWNAGRGYDGPRVLELDGFGETLQDINPTVADWTFEEGAPGATVTGAQDYSGNQHHITQVLASTLPASFVRSSSDVHGAISVGLPPGNGGFGNALRANDSVDFNLGTEFTLEASINPGSFNTEFNRGILVGQDAASGRLVYAFDYRSETRIVNFLIADNQGQIAAVQAMVPNDGRSHHLAGVFSGGVLRIYLDKQLVESEATALLPGLTPGGAGRVTLGANDIGGYWFTGALDRVRISRKALAPNEFFPTNPDDPASPLVILQPLENVTVAEGGSATFHVVASGGTNTLAYRWTFNGQTLSNHTSDTLILNNVRPADAGTYLVTVASGPWEVSSTANLTVTSTGAGAPVITAHPESRFTGAGFAAQFSVSATSSTPISYQWFFNGAAIPGETNSTLWVVNIALEDAGTYYVSVRNSSGSTLSQPAILNVFSSGFTGGTVLLDNHGPDVNVPITDDRGVRVTGPEFLAQLYGGALGQGVVQVGAAIPFGTGENAGYFSDPIERVIPGTTAGTRAHFEVRVWDSRAGSTYEEAAANGGLHGSSNPILDTLGGGLMVPATLRFMQPFSLAARPTITEQPADLSVRAGQTAVFEVSAAGTAPLSYQWRFNNVPVAGQTAATLTLNNVSEANAGNYSVDVRNVLGVVTSRVARLTVVPRDSQAPVVTLTAPTNSITTNPRITLAGTVTDNGAITRVEWHRNGQFLGPITLGTNGAFSIPNLVLSPGTNQFAVTAYDEDENVSSAFVSVHFEAQRAIWVGAVPPVQEGASVAVPIVLNSVGDIGAISFSLAYDTNYLSQPNLIWRTADGNAFTQVNADQPGLIRGTYVLPGRAIRPGTNELALVSFRTRSVPETLNSPLNLEVQGVYSASGDPLSAGTGIGSGEVRILRRQIIGDNNANDRLDVGDATAILRLLTLLDPIRAWDTSGNDLNQNALLDPGDAVRVLRAVVNLDPQPRVPGQLQQQAEAEGDAPPLFTLRSDATRLVRGQRIKVSVDVAGTLPAINGASFRLDFPTNALHIEGSESHAAGPIVPGGAMMLWNVSGGSDATAEFGHVNFAVSGPTSWAVSGGLLAEVTFIVLEDAGSERFWNLTLSHGEIASGTDVRTSAASRLLLEGRAPAPANLTVGSFNAATGTFELTLAGDPGAEYRIEASSDLQTWTQISVMTADSGVIRVSDSQSNPAPHRFYRAIQLP